MLKPTLWGFLEVMGISNTGIIFTFLAYCYIKISYPQSTNISTSWRSSSLKPLFIYVEKALRFKTACIHCLENMDILFYSFIVFERLSTPYICNWQTCKFYPVGLIQLTPYGKTSFLFIFIFISLFWSLNISDFWILFQTGYNICLAPSWVKYNF